MGKKTGGNILNNMVNGVFGSGPPVPDGISTSSLTGHMVGGRKPRGRQSSKKLKRGGINLTPFLTAIMALGLRYANEAVDGKRRGRRGKRRGGNAVPSLEHFVESIKFGESSPFKFNESGGDDTSKFSASSLRPASELSTGTYSAVVAGGKGSRKRKTIRKRRGGEEPDGPSENDQEVNQQNLEPVQQLNDVDYNQPTGALLDDLPDDAVMITSDTQIGTTGGGKSKRRTYKKRKGGNHELGHVDTVVGGRRRKRRGGEGEMMPDVSEVTGTVVGGRRRKRHGGEGEMMPDVSEVTGTVVGGRRRKRRGGEGEMIPDVSEVTGTVVGGRRRKRRGGEGEMAAVMEEARSLNPMQGGKKKRRGGNDSCSVTEQAGGKKRRAKK
jgi:hypothetical protein